VNAHSARAPEKRKFLSRKNKKITLGVELILWLITAWLLYPLMILDSVNMDNAKEYFYRSAGGITIMIIFFGKTITDLLFPQMSSKKMPLFDTIFLTIYSVLLGGGIVFMFVRMVLLLMKSRKSGFLF
jgi:hypothetical protein